MPRPRTSKGERRGDRLHVLQPERGGRARAGGHGTAAATVAHVYIYTQVLARLLGNLNR